MRYSQVYDENHIITVDVATSAATIASFQKIMMDRSTHEFRPECTVMCI